MEPIGAASLRIVVADDCEDIADTLALVLGERGYTVAVAHDGLTAVRVAVDFQPDVILLDIGMPGINGYEAARRIRQAMGSAVVLVALTAWSQAEDKKRAKLAGFDHHIAKPADFGFVEQTLAALSTQKQNRKPSEREAVSLAATSLKGY